MSIARRLGYWAVLSLFAIAFAATAGAEEPATSPEDIQTWIRQLDSDKFIERQQASTRLGAARAAAIEPLAKAAETGSAEVSSRTLDFLKQASSSPEAETRDTARAALERLVKSGDEGLARRAAKILKPEPAAPATVPPAAGLPKAPLFPGGGQIQINVQANAQFVRVRVENGKRTVEAQENGVKTEIVDDPQNGISITVTEKINGQDKITKHQAKNADDLKKNHPEGDKVYQKYANMGRINVQGFQLVGPGAPNVLPLLPLAPQVRKQTADEVAEARKLLTDARSLLKKAGDEKPSAEEIKKALDQLDSAGAKLEAAGQKLER